jgi:iron complex outermembrane receptor protein
MGLNIYATVQNVATITNYDGLDPEVFSGIDNNLYPRPRTYILGIKFNF